jgi:hypothetical protein
MFLRLIPLIFFILFINPLLYDDFLKNHLVFKDIFMIHL